MLINSKWILFICFVELNTVLYEFSDTQLKYGIPKSALDNVTKEVNKFNFENVDIKEFREKFYDNILTESVSSTQNNPNELIKLILLAIKFLNRKKELKVVNKECGGHTYEDSLDPSGWALGYAEEWTDAIIESAKKKYNKVRNEYVQNQNISFVSEVVIICGSSKVEQGLESLIGGLGGMGLGAAFGPFFPLVFLGSFIAGSTLAIRRAQDITCKFSYIHKSECLDNCSNILTKVSVCSVENLVNSLKILCNFIEHKVKEDEKLEELENYISEIKKVLESTRVENRSLMEKFRSAKSIINEFVYLLDNCALSEEGKSKFQRLNEAFRNLSNNRIFGR